MRIQNTAPIYQALTRTHQTNSGSGSFIKQLDIAAARRSMDSCEFYPKNRVKPDSEWELSPYVNLMVAHEQWKEQQPPQELPDSQGRTAENMAYLREHYSGSLSWMDRVDMLETMKSMGVISREQRNSAYGDNLTIAKFDKNGHEIVLKQGRIRSDPWNQDWNVYFSEDPINGFKTADDVFTWLDTLPLEEDE